MNNRELHYMSISDAASLIRAGELSPVELTEVYLERIDALNDRLAAYITVMRDSALAQARQAEQDTARYSDR